MQVLHVMSGLDPASGGPAQALVGLATAQQRSEGDVHVIASTRASLDRTYIDRLEAAGVTVHTLGPCTGSLCRHPKLASFVHDAIRCAAVVHIHGVWEQIQHDAATACRRLCKPHIIRPCGMLDPWSLSQKWLKKRIYMLWRLRRNLNGATLLHFTSATEQQLTRPLKLKAPGIVEANGVSLDEFAQLPTRGAFRSCYPQLADRPMILFMSRLHGKKGLDLLIPAFARMTNRDAMLVLAGPDDRGYKAEVEAMIAEYNIGERVIVPGMLKGEQKIAALADADLFALPSYQENFGIAVVEALAAGTPVIISDQVNIHAEISRAGVGGVVPTQIEPLTHSLDHWLADSALRESAARNASHFVKHNYDWDEIASRWACRYKSLIAGSLPAEASRA